MTGAPVNPGRPHPLLLDWLDTEPAGQQRGGRVLVVGSDADAAAVALARHTAVIRVAPGTGLRTRGKFELVIVTAEGDVPSSVLIGAALRLASDGRLLVIAAIPGGDPRAVLGPLAGAGLELLLFDDVTDGPRGGGGRWLRAVCARRAPATSVIARSARNRRRSGA